MTDLLYLLDTVAFFAIMRGYASFCERMGRAATEEHVDAGPRA